MILFQVKLVNYVKQDYSIVYDFVWIVICWVLFMSHDMKRVFKIVWFSDKFTEYDFNEVKVVNSTDRKGERVAKLTYKDLKGGFKTWDKLSCKDNLFYDMFHHCLYELDFFDEVRSNLFEFLCRPDYEMDLCDEFVVNDICKLVLIGFERRTDTFDVKRYV